MATTTTRIATTPMVIHIHVYPRQKKHSDIEAFKEVALFENCYTKVSSSIQYSKRLLTLTKYVKQHTWSMYFVFPEQICTSGYAASPFVSVHWQSSGLVPQQPQTPKVLPNSLRSSRSSSPQGSRSSLVWLFYLCPFPIHSNLLFLRVFSISFSPVRSLKVRVNHNSNSNYNSNSNVQYNIIQ